MSRSPQCLACRGREGGAEPTPWEERGKRGIVAAYLETVKRTFMDPVRFFERMRVDDADGVLSAVKATQRSIYDRVYPLTYSLYLYTSEKTPGTAYGFSAFVAEDIGQRVFLYAGLVPKTMPYRTIQLTQE